MIKIGVKTNIAFVSHRLIPMLLGAVFLFFFASCGMGLDPAWKSESGLHINFGNPNSALDSRALAGGNGASGHLSIRTESKAGTQVWGPWKITPPQAFSTSEIPAGTYSSIILVYGTSPVDTAWLADQKSSTLEASLAEKYPGQVSWAEKKSFVIKEGAVTQLSATLIPAVPEVLTIDLQSGPFSVPLVSLPNEKNAFRFIKLTNLDYNPTDGESLYSFTLTPLSEVSSEGNTFFSPSSLGLFTASGEFVANIPLDPVNEGMVSWTLKKADPAWSVVSSGTLYLSCAWNAEKSNEIELRFDTNPIDPVEPEVPASVQLTGANGFEGKRVLVAIETEPLDPENSIILSGGFGIIGADGSVRISLLSASDVTVLWKPIPSASYLVTMLIDETNKWPTDIEKTAMNLMPEKDIAGSRMWQKSVSATKDGTLAVEVPFSESFVLSSYLLYPEVDSETAFLQVGYLFEGKKILFPPWNSQTNGAYIKANYTFKGWATSKADATAGKIAYAAGEESMSIYTGTPGVNIKLWPVWIKDVASITFEVNPASIGTTEVRPSIAISMTTANSLTGPEGFASYRWTLNGIQFGTSQTLSLDLAIHVVPLNPGENEIVLFVTDSEGVVSVVVQPFTLTQ